MRPEVLGAVSQRVLDSVSPASGAVLMRTGIVSVTLLLDGQRALSTVLLVLDAVIWVALALLLPARALADRQRFESDSRHPVALTAVAGTAVLGTRLTLAGWDWAGTALLIVAAAIRLGLVPRVLAHWQVPTIGASFILTVGPSRLHSSPPRSRFTTAHRGSCTHLCCLASACASTR